MKATTKSIYEYFYRKERDPYKAMALCYYAYVWYLVFKGKEIAPFKFEKTIRGPVDTSVFSSPSAELSGKMIDYLYYVYSSYRNYSGEELISRVKSEPPFTGSSKTIRKKDIKKFFRSLKTS